MTPEAQQIAIAEARGWTGIRSYQIAGLGSELVGVPPHNQHLSAYRERSLPDYLNDLNAMHEAEKILRGVQVSFYESHLERDCVDDLEGYVWHATAAQRAEAFLRTIGKWEVPA